MEDEIGSNSPLSELGTPTRSNSNSIHAKVLQRDKLSRRLTSIRENLDQFSRLSSYQLETKLSLIDYYFNLFNKLQSELESLDESQIDQDHRCAFEDSFCEVKSAIAQRIAETRRVDPLNRTTLPIVHSTSTTRHNLPKLQLTKFSGNHTEWLDFYNMFRTLVHNNSALDDIEKFQYLRFCLTNNSFRLIQSLEVSSNNYERAIELLVRRFDNKRYIFQSHLQTIFDSKGLRTSSASSLREFIDSINSNLRALQSLATRTQIADGMLLHFLVTKLDPEMQVKWEEYLAAKWDNPASSQLQVPSSDDLATFIEKRCQTVNIIEVSRKAKGMSAANSLSSMKSGTSFVSSSSSKCLLCNEAISHSAFKCAKFNAMDPLQRYNLAKRNRLCLNCLGASHTSNKCPFSNRCQYCKVSHHTLLHRHTQPSLTTSGEDASQPPCTSSSLTLNISKSSVDVILATALVQLSTTNGVKIIARALLDSASQLNFITERIAQLLKLQRNKMNLEISGIGVLKTKSHHGGMVTLHSLHTGFSAVLETVILPTISSHQPHNLINISNWGIPKNISLADSAFNRPATIDILIGAAIFFDILSVGQIKLDGNLPTLQKTQLGWIVAGNTNSRPLVSPSPSALITSTSSIDPLSTTSSASQPSLDKLLENFWKIEDPYHSRKVERMLEENECEIHFQQTTHRCPVTNKFVVRLPFSSSPSKLGQSLEIARRRFFALEKKLITHKELKGEYESFIQEYIDMKHMVLVQPTELSAKARNYIPHHCVMKLDSSTTRLRLVFDASCRTANGTSLNSILRTGPTVQDDIFTILLRFRTHRFVLMADITMMYRQIIVDERDSKYQCILWRNSPEEPLRTYQLQTVTYGTSSAPFLAVRCLQQLAHENLLTHPIGAAVTLRDFYVDNLMTGAATVEEVLTIKNEVVNLLTKGGFPLRKFASNNDNIITDIPIADKESTVNIGEISYIKALGLKWSPQGDFFLFSYTPMEQPMSKSSKRTILSNIASFFDPLGL